MTVTLGSGSHFWFLVVAPAQESDGCDMNRTPRIQKFTWNDDGTLAALQDLLLVPSGDKSPKQEQP